jgi:hypothetical protein
MNIHSAVNITKQERIRTICQPDMLTRQVQQLQLRFP